MYGREFVLNVCKKKIIITQKFKIVFGDPVSEYKCVFYEEN